MEKTYYTIGMAGHIDHGKTALTKALTNVDTDRLKEEKERGISIEPGYAPFQTEDGTQLSIIDVPGHERFIRQMIAGVAGIDLVVLVIAADEGVMPQTEEHLEILQFLGVEHCIVAITKIDRVDEIMLELVQEDIQERLEGTIFDGAPYMLVDSLSGTGIDQLKSTIIDSLQAVKFRDAYGSFRLPIDQVFTVQGQGTVVRGTIYEGAVQKGTQLTLLPKGLKVKARQIQVHHEEREEARAGQRTAINLGGIEKTDVFRGNVLVASDHFLVTDTIDVALNLTSGAFTPLKQRSPVKVHVGTSEVMGKIVFFDRNELEQTDEEVLCQIRLDEEIVVRRGDRFILRRPTPVETLGGGWVIQPRGGKYRFGPETIEMLQNVMQGTPEDLVEEVLSKNILLDLQQLIQQTSLDEPVLKETIAKGVEDGSLLEVGSQKFSLAKTFSKIKGEIGARVESYHTDYPMRPGMSKAELTQSLSAGYPKPFIEYSLNALAAQGELKKTGQFIALGTFEPHLPKQWKVRMVGIISALEKDGIQVKKWEQYFEGTPLPKDEITDLTLYLLETGQIYRLQADTMIHRNAVKRAVTKLKQDTAEAFGLKEAKDSLDLSRKYLIPLLELFDLLDITEREEDQRRWTGK
ncbi:selenocysteine-specific translation elongation factor [Planococcus halotolerans]|uniref:Selenocysteine-specific elongation factor n=1 Tax=Planococcus halotolerans TaxID=2233542 RepID=A0A365L6M9_9BACL|nr:selenocysteine-specific translation elongation factor [Planococcus halotolerans]QHJ70193.1 selenocysteine-specific translation elongation factor [Planococcus halotolerans]RAZ81076.1 selenocysteine-specific translation elongation factor [Planococcus halotolerans]